MAGSVGGGRTLDSLIAFAFILSTAAGPAAATGLGPVAQHSALGQSLRVVIPLLAEGGEDLATECFKLAPAEQESDGIPQVFFGRVSLERTPSGAQLVVTHPRPVNDPVLRLTVQAGCDAGVRREYTLFMDPPAIEAPQLAADSATRSEAEAPSRAAARPPARGTDIAVREAAGTEATGAPPEPRKAAPPRSRTAARAATKRASAPSEQPRLKLAAPAPQPSPGAAAGAVSEARQAQAQQDLANAIEAETVVLKQRIAELSATVERLQQELKASETADRAAAEAAKPPPPPPPPPPAWWEANWPLLAAIVGLPVLIAGGLLWKRRREAEAQGPDWRAAGVSATRTETPMRSRTAPALRSAAAGVTQPRPEPGPPPGTRSAARAHVVPGTPGALAVSELLHVTEEARVYVALGHPERAIDVLNEHLERSPRSVPAAWLMLLDLYHANGRKQEFRQLAEDFHANCNVQTPLWESFAAGEPGDVGLDAFPHIVRQVVGRWGKPECRAYLEQLLYENREGRRTGFPLGAYGDILLLLQIGDAPPAIDIDSDLAKAGKLDLGGPDRGAGGKPPA